MGAVIGLTLVLSPTPATPLSPARHEVAAS
jgi:hypothetical protein